VCETRKLSHCVGHEIRNLSCCYFDELFTLTDATNEL
jgi:hypothetical protein